jgi:hypothetical protein
MHGSTVGPRNGPTTELYRIITEYESLLRDIDRRATAA